MPSRSCANAERDARQLVRKGQAFTQQGKHASAYRVYREERLQVRTKQRKRLSRPRVPMLVPDTVNQRWSLDFMREQGLDPEKPKDRETSSARALEKYYRKTTEAVLSGKTTCRMVVQAHLDRIEAYDAATVNGPTGSSTS